VEGVDQAAMDRASLGTFLDQAQSELSLLLCSVHRNRYELPVSKHGHTF
jgi:hypothetical protein